MNTKPVSLRFLLRNQQTVTHPRAFGRPGTHLTEDGEGFGQSLAQQADPFGKQLVQMFPEMLADKEHTADFWSVDLCGSIPSG